MIEEDYKSLKILESNLSGVYNPFIELGIVTKGKLTYQLELFKEKINEEVLRSIIDELPEVWIDNKRDLLKLNEYIMYRLNKLNIIIENICSYLNLWGSV